MRAQHAEVGDDPLSEAEITEVNGRMCVVHKILPQDSLPRLSIMYNVDESVIRVTNSLPSDQIHHLKSIKIPMTESFRYAPKEKLTQEQA